MFVNACPNKYLALTLVGKLFIGGVVLLFIPLAGLAGGLPFCFTLSQYRMPLHFRRLLIQILQYQQQDVPAEQQRREAALLFPKDARFQPMTSDEGAP